MLKIAQKEKTKADKGMSVSVSGVASTTTSSSSVSGKGSMKLKLPTKKNKTDKQPKEAGVKLKLKLGGGKSSNAPVAATSDPPAASTKPKVTLKIKTPATGKHAPSSAEVSAPPTPTSVIGSSKEKEKKKPRLTLKLGKPKPVPENSTGPTPMDTSPDKSAAASPPKSTTSQSANKISLKMPVGPRGKELPKGVAPPPVTGKQKPTGTKKVTVKKAGATKAKVAIPGDATVASNKSTKAKVAIPADASVASNKSTKSKAAIPGDASVVSSKSTKSSKSSTKKKDSSKTKITFKAPSSSSSTAGTSANRGMIPMTPPRKAQCNKVLNAIKRRKPKQIVWFLNPVSDKVIVQDYRKKIKFPVDLSTMQSKLDKNEYDSIASFVLDLRRIFANCLRYNTSIKDSLRPIAVEVLVAAEEFMTVFLAKPEQPTQVYPPMLFCWKLCLSVLDTLYNLTNPEDGQPTALYFLHPVSFYCGGQFPPDYLEKVSKPMDFGNVTAQLIEGQYTSVDQFAADCMLVIDNCNTYYGGREDSKIFTDQANRLKEVLTQQLEALNRYLRSTAGEAQKKVAQTTVVNSALPKPPIPLLQSTLDELRVLKYTDKATKITESAMGPFERPVSVATFPDYPQHVQSPMDLQTVERKVKSEAYATPEDFEYDMLLIFNNCVAYNAARKVDHMVAMGKHGLKHFRRVFANKMRIFEDPSAAVAPSPKEMEAKRQSPPEGGATQGPPKKIKLELGVSRGKSAPRISLNLAGASVPAPSAAVAAQNKAKMSPKSAPVTLPKPKLNINVKPNQPVPLHIAISRVKESFPLRRAVKGLQSWEAGCARFFKDMMRHPWISAARPKFIFHVPVPVLFPVSNVPARGYDEVGSRVSRLTVCFLFFLYRNFERYTLPK
jgi:hypothetical protein